MPKLESTETRAKAQISDITSSQLLEQFLTTT